ncbi:IS1182 family transposase [Botryobacter ruber]|uniref:IS1182 family transposase n=1 Tax=Botryobacter ruber TaxID=2171629 RepID=UPI000E0A3BCF|nr:IS1182 family transposase [Botryobacter ruber]
MSLHPQTIPAIPSETVRVAQAAFPHGNIYMQLKDELGSIYQDEAFASLFPQRGQPAASPWQLAMVTVMQYIENLSDRQAADAVRSRIDWKYALSLELTDAGFDSSVLSEFRSRLVRGSGEDILLNLLLDKCRERNWIKAKGRQRTDSTHVLGWIRATSRLVCAGETLRAALNSLAIVAPQWLRQHSPPEWLKRYARRVEDSRLPEGKEKQAAYALQVGMDGHALLEAVYEQEAGQWLASIPAVEVLRQVWLQQFGIENGGIFWRSQQQEGIPPAARFISSPYDLQAHYARKNTTSWIGYKVHLTETCEEDLPHLITNVATTAGPIPDMDMTQPIHQSLKEKELLPEIHLVDTGYLDTPLLATSRQDFGVDLLGPSRANYQWQAQTKEGFAAASFQLDWQNQEAICPLGKHSVSWSAYTTPNGIETVKIKFSQKDCSACPGRSKCTKAKRRSITVHKEEHYLALQAARERENTEAWKKEYNKRAGIEGTISQGVRAFGLRRAKYVGLAKTHLQHVLTATAINFGRIANWLADVPWEKTRISAFEKLMLPLKTTL